MFRFTIRELVLLTALVAMALGWALDGRNLRSERAELRTYKDDLDRALRRGGYYLDGDIIGLVVKKQRPPGK